MKNSNHTRTVVAGILLGVGLMSAGQVVAEQYVMKVQVSGLKEALTSSFASHRFTNCGQTGRYGPDFSQCQSAYSGSEIFKPEYAFSVNSGYQRWTVPENGTYKISAAGARGGSGNSGYYAGKGIHIQGNFSLSKGDQLIMVVGQMGESVNLSNHGGGGGGGSFVVKGSSRTSATPLLVAGGGGGFNGANWPNTGTYGLPEDAQSTNQGDVSRDWEGYQGNGASYSHPGLRSGNIPDAQPFTLGAFGGESTCYNIAGGFGGGGSPHCHNGEWIERFHSGGIEPVRGEGFGRYALLGRLAVVSRVVHSLHRRW
jgi:hypothetical protein